ncbi:putative tetratricopeptide-like helical domain, DYW domain-containing protein [Rosa chinensis]|uniref:Putative tetratricopeptide-like helical domain, DYW domain-containing protein n=1 Tax=Rosa chinensis TaxID=74649 RepID=A0A2P6S8G3_ROSCH|nr:pentatricopeptide repeat-containing protein At5g04780, mitochondrial [Rosa chinensis]PRQ54981.1 putative tetratricopeptide-like helical domain, DYW domain-containing protein [Rosa chinensis]
MRTLRRYKEGLFNSSTAQIYYRKFSAIGNAKADRPRDQECLVWLGTSATHISLLHQILQSSARTGAPMEGKACHAQSIRVGLQSNTLTSNMLINMYSKCGFHNCARKVFDEMPERSLVSWNTMIGSLARNGEEQEALSVFVRMQREENQFSEFTVSSVLFACAVKCAVSECKQLHAFAIKVAMVLNVYVGTALLDVYSKSGLIKDASFVFESMPERSDVTWSSMVAGYVQNGLYEEALVLLHRAQMIGLEHNQFTISSAICACAGLAALIEGKQVHALLFKTGFGLNIYIVSSLIDMYSKCGSIGEAYTVFQGMEDRNTVLWNAMISGFSRHACSLEVMILFEKMQQTGMLPSEVAYISVLTACSHMGLVESGRKYFNLMITEHNVSPNVVHHACMVDILGRSGLILEAHNLIENMPFDATASMWGSLLASCRIHGNFHLAEIAAKHLSEIEPNSAGNLILLSNIYAANNKWEEVARTRKLLKESELKKERGKSWIEIKDKVHSFMVGERKHPRISEIYSKLDQLVEELRMMGYKAEIEHDLHYVEESRKHELLRHHSEKLAFTFGLMCLPSTAPIRIMKNLRICGDCHSFMKIASSCLGREIIVRDAKRFHHFKNGFCSCREFW